MSGPFDALCIDAPNHHFVLVRESVQCLTGQIGLADIDPTGAGGAGAMGH